MRFTEFVEKKLTPAINKFSRNVYIASVQETLIGLLPFVLVSSICTLLSKIPGMTLVDTIGNYTMGIISLAMSFLLPYHIMTKSKIANKALITGATGMANFILYIDPIMGNGKVEFISSRLGSGGLFVSIISGILVGAVMKAFAKKPLFSKDSVLPDFIIIWFEVLIPIFLILAFGLLLIQVGNVDIFTTVVNFFQPLGSFLQSFPGYIVYNGIAAAAFAFGFSSWLFSPITYPIFFAAIEQNSQLAAAGQFDKLNIVSSETGYMFIIGGMGLTLALAVMVLLFSKSKRLKSIGKATFIPTLFNVNEPLVFGAPVASNAKLMVPFILCNMLGAGITYIALALKLVTIPYKMFQMWYLPYPLLTFILTDYDWRSIVLTVVLFAVAFAVYWPFFKSYDNELVENEKLIDKEKQEKLQTENKVEYD